MEYPSFNITERTKMYHEKALKYFKECIVSFHKDFCEHNIMKKEFLAQFLAKDESTQFFEQLLKVCKSEASKVKVENGLLRALADKDNSGRIHLHFYIKYID